MKKIFVLISLLLITSCNSVIESKVQYTPIEKINIELKLFIENNDEKIYLIQTNHDTKKTINYSTFVEIEKNEKSLTLFTDKLADFHPVYYENTSKMNSRVPIITFVYIEYFKEYYLIDFEAKQVLDERGKFVSYQTLFSNKPQA